MMYVQWTPHARDRAAERFNVQDVMILRPLILAAWNGHERWWEMDNRGRYNQKDRMRGAVLNLVVPIKWEGATVFVVTRRCDLDPDRYWVISVLTHPQYLNNRKRMWKRRRGGLRRATAEPVRHYPFKGLRVKKEGEE